MSDGTSGIERREMPVLVGLGVALLLAIGALVWCYGLSNHLKAAEQKLAATEQRNLELENQQQALSDRLRATSETLGQSVGLTQKQIETQAQTLMESQAAAVRAQNAQAAKLEREQQAAVKQIGAVATDVGSAKTNIAKTQTDLEDAKAQLQRTIGDQGVMSGLIARTHEELEGLKHKGDRNYYEFTLQKGAKPTLLSTVKLQAKKVDDKRSKYTLMVSADDRNIEKKDKSLDEPVQFYTGKDPVLYEIVVNNISKNVISGYLSTPKGAVQPMAAPPR